MSDQQPEHLEARKSRNDDEQNHVTNATTVAVEPIPKELLTVKFDIEHVPVENDPRKWSPMRKNITLVLIASAAMIAGLAASIQNPAVKEMEVDLPATSAQFSWSISLFILIQGLMPLIWSAIGEVKGRRVVYIISLSLFTIGSVVVAISKNISLVIGFRCFQGAGSSAVISTGAATLADIFDPYERGTKMGIYYMAPLLGPSLGPIFGGVLTTGFNWRAIFWFLTIVSGASLLSFLLFFRDTFRRERSLIYHNAMKKRILESSGRTTEDRSGIKTKQVIDPEKKVQVDVDVKKLEEGAHTTTANVKLTLTDINPIKPIGQILRRKNNLITLSSSGLLFAYNFFIQYTVSRTLSTHYHYEALKIGLVTLAYGIGCMAGSLLGGRWSDIQLAKLKAKNNGISQPEMRLHSILVGIIALPPCTIAFGWVCQQHVHVSAICVFLFFCGFLSIWTYSSTLAYIVDANNGRSSSAAATNSAFRGVFAFAATEIAVPMQDGLGDGWMYTIWAGIMIISGALLVLVMWKGGEWREHAEISEAKTGTK